MRLPSTPQLAPAKVASSMSPSGTTAPPAGGELEQIQLLLGHASVQTTERYLGTKQNLVHAPNDGIKLTVEPESAKL
jgi:integrase